MRPYLKMMTIWDFKSALSTDNTDTTGPAPQTADLEVTPGTAMAAYMTATRKHHDTTYAPRHSAAAEAEHVMLQNELADLHSALLSKYSAFGFFNRSRPEVFAAEVLSCIHMPRRGGGGATQARGSGATVLAAGHQAAHHHGGGSAGACPAGPEEDSDVAM